MKISILIPTFNGEKTLGRLLQKLKRQTIVPAETCVVDSGSQDATVQICLEHGVNVSSISKEDFDHGGTRSLMARKASGDIVLFLTQDAVPATDDAVEKLVAPFGVDEKVAMTYGRQLPNQDADFAAAHLRLFNYPDQPAVRQYKDKKKLGIRTIFTSNSFAAYRKEALAEVEYFKTGLIFGEDTCAAGRLLQKGYTLRYVNDALVYHSHNYKLMQEFKRSFDIGVLHSTESKLFADFGNAKRRGAEYVKSGITNLLQQKQYVQTADFMARSMLKMIGYTAGKNYKRLPAEVVPGLSMNQTWWKKE